MLNLFNSAVTFSSSLSRPSLQAFSLSKNSFASWNHDIMIQFLFLTFDIFFLTIDIFVLTFYILFFTFWHLLYLWHFFPLWRKKLLPGLLSLNTGLDSLHQVFHQFHPSSHPLLRIWSHVICVGLPQSSQFLLIKNIWDKYIMQFKTNTFCNWRQLRFAI